MAKINIDPLKFFQVVAISFILIEILSWLLSSISPSIPLLRGGWVLIIFAVIILLTYLFSLSLNISQIQLKRDIPILIIILGVIGLLYFFLPQIVPQLFSIGGSTYQGVRDFLVNGVGSILSTRTGVTG